MANTIFTSQNSIWQLYFQVVLAFTSSSYSWGPVSVAPKLSIISSGQSCPQCLAVSPVLVATTDKDHIQHPGSTLMEPAKTTLK